MEWVKAGKPMDGMPSPVFDKNGVFIGAEDTKGYPYNVFYKVCKGQENYSFVANVGVFEMPAEEIDSWVR